MMLVMVVSIAFRLASTGRTQECCCVGLNRECAAIHDDKMPPLADVCKPRRGGRGWWWPTPLDGDPCVTGDGHILPEQVGLRVLLR